LASYTFNNVTADHTIVASFSQLSYTITATAGAGGAIDPKGAINVIHGANQLFSFTPNEGFHIYAVWIDGDSIGQANSFEFLQVVDNHTIHVEFALIIGIEESEQININGYPNPINDFLIVEVSKTEMGTPLTYQPSDLHGKTLLTGRLINGLNRVQTNMLTPGTYILFVHSAKKHIYSKKLVNN